MRWPLALMVALLAVACSPGGDEAETLPPPTSTTTTSPEVPTTSTGDPPMEVRSSAFASGQTIPTEFTCDGADVSPPLTISGLPSETGSLVIIVDDPDAPVGIWDHWVEYDIPIADRDLEIPVDTGPVGVQGVNSWNLTGYGGPCPPEGEEHGYFFKVYAIKGTLDLPERVDSEVVRQAMRGRILSQVQLTGRYGR